MTPKELLVEFFNSDIANDIKVIEKYYHQDCEVHWNSSKGYKFSNFKETIAFYKNITESYDELRFELSHLVEEGKTLALRYTLYASTIEATDDIPLAHYSSIIEIKDVPAEEQQP